MHSVEINIVCYCMTHKMGFFVKMVSGGRTSPVEGGGYERRCKFLAVVDFQLNSILVVVLVRIFSTVWI